MGGFPAHAVIRKGSDVVPDDLAGAYRRVGSESPPYVLTLPRRVGGFPAHAVIRKGSDVVPDDRAGAYHRVGSESPPYVL